MAYNAAPKITLTKYYKNRFFLYNSPYISENIQLNVTIIYIIQRSKSISFKPSCQYNYIDTRYKIQDTRYFISGTKPIVKT